MASHWRFILPKTQTPSPIHQTSTVTIALPQKTYYPIPVATTRCSPSIKVENIDTMSESTVSSTISGPSAPAMDTDSSQIKIVDIQRIMQLEHSLKCPFCPRVCVSETQLSIHKMIHGVPLPRDPPKKTPYRRRVIHTHVIDKNIVAVVKKNLELSESDDVPESVVLNPTGPDPLQIIDTKPENSSPKTVSSSNPNSLAATENNYKCSSCPLLFETAIEFMVHSRFHTPAVVSLSSIKTLTKSVKASTRSIKTGTGQTRPDHTYAIRMVESSGSETEADDYKCETCSRRYKNYVQYTRHQKLHIYPLNTSKCHICGFLCKGPLKVAGHIKRMHSDGLTKRKHACSLCDDNFLSLKSLNTHVHRKHGKSPEWLRAPSSEGTYET